MKLTLQLTLRLKMTLKIYRLRDLH
jgi:hypothetical protein